MKTARNITLVSLLAAGVIAVPAYASYQQSVDRSAVKATITFTEPNQHGFDFAALQTGPNVNTGYVDFVGVKQKLDFGLGVEHRLSNGVSRLFLDYDRFRSEQSSELNTIAGRQLNLLGVPAVTGAFGEYEVEADTLKFGSRHRLEFGPSYTVDLGAALSWIDADRDTSFTHRDGADVRELQQEADFDAFGPFFDVSTKYYLQGHSKHKRGFNLQAYAGAGLLYSETKFTSRLFVNGAVTESFDREKVKGVSSEMAAKLAIGWDYCFSNKTVLSTSLGYMLTHYSDAWGGATSGAYNRFTTSNGNAGAGSTSVGFPFTRQGPFLEFKWSGVNF